MIVSLYKLIRKSVIEIEIYIILFFATEYGLLVCLGINFVGKKTKHIMKNFKKYPQCFFLSNK